MTPRAHLPRSLSIALVALVLAISLGTFASAVTNDPVPCSEVPEWASVSDCTQSPGPTQSPTQSNSPRPTNSATPSGTATPTGPGSARPTPSSTGTPSTNAEEWATEAGKGIPTLTDAVQKSYSEQTGMSRNYWAIYAIMFGFGLIIFAVMFVISLAKASRGGVRERAAFLDSLPKFFFWSPLMSLVPASVAWVYVQLAQPIEQGIGAETNGAIKDVIAATNKYFFQDPMGLLNQVGGAIVGFFLFMGTVVVLIVWLIEHEVAKFGVYLLTVLVPVSAALSLSPKWAKMGARTVAAVIGCMAVPIMTKLAFWVAWAAMGDALRSGDNFLMSLLTIVVIFSLATSAPIMLSYLAPNLLPYGGTAYGNSGGSARAHSQQAMNHAGNALSRLTNGFKGKGMGTGGAAAEGAAGRVAGAGAAEAAGAAAVAGGAVLGGLAAAGMAIGAAHDAVESASRSAAGEQLGAVSGGHTSHAGGSSMPMPSLSGAGGSSSRSAGGSASPRPTQDSATIGESGGTGGDSPTPTWSQPIDGGGPGGGSPASAWSTPVDGGAGPAGVSIDGGGIGPVGSDLAAGTTPGAAFGGTEGPMAAGGMDMSAGAGMPAVSFGAGEAPLADSTDSVFSPPPPGDGPLPSSAPDFIPAPAAPVPSLFSPVPASSDADGGHSSFAPLTAEQLGLVGAPRFIPDTSQPRIRVPRDSGEAPTPPPAPTPAPQPPPPARPRSVPRWPFGRRSR